MPLGPARLSATEYRNPLTKSDNFGRARRRLEKYRRFSRLAGSCMPSLHGKTAGITDKSVLSMTLMVETVTAYQRAVERNNSVLAEIRSAKQIRIERILRPYLVIN